MSDLLLRVLRRRASILLESAEEFCREEWTNTKTGKLDDDLSVFEILETQLIRAHAEHLGSNLSPNDKIRGGVTLHGIDGFDVKDTRGTSKWFKFSREHHRSIRLFDDDETMALVGVVFEQRCSRERSASPEEVRLFVNARMSEMDPEWTVCLSDPERASQCRDWKKWLARVPKPKSAEKPEGATPGDDDSKAPPQSPASSQSASTGNGVPEQAKSPSARPEPPTATPPVSPIVPPTGSILPE
jgi:hypothetical protein